MKREHIRLIWVFLRESGKKYLRFLKWIFVSCLVGIVVGLVGTAFAWGMKEVTAIREQYPQLLFGLPIAGIIIVLLYHLAHRDNDKGTNSVLAAVRSEEELTIKMTPLIFISTLLTHLCGGSAGREGAALQMGGSIGNAFGKLFRMNKNDGRIMIMCGMSACFAAVFRTPMAAAVFSMEVVSVGSMYYPAIVPCVLSGLIASGIAGAAGVAEESMAIAVIPRLTLATGGMTILLAVLCAAVSVIFCILLHVTAAEGKKRLRNPYIRIAIMGAAVILLVKVLHLEDYTGAGMNIVERCIREGQVSPWAFFWKMILTALTLGAGYKGGEIVPSFCVGAAFGCTAGGLLGLPPSLCAAVGMTAVFCGVTNSPITSLMIALELFGMEAFPYFLLGVAVSYTLSGYHSLYHTQKILYSKDKEEDWKDMEYRGKSGEQKTG